MTYSLREDDIPAMLVALQTNGDLILHLMAALLQQTQVNNSYHTIDQLRY